VRTFLSKDGLHLSGGDDLRPQRGRVVRVVRDEDSAHADDGQRRCHCEGCDLIDEHHAVAPDHTRRPQRAVQAQ
jgi:hypothetical protein